MVTESEARKTLEILEEYKSRGKYLVLVRDPSHPRQGQMCLATRRIMTWGQAQDYIASVDRSHFPVIVKVMDYPAGLPEGIRGVEE